MPFIVAEALAAKAVETFIELVDDEGINDVAEALAAKAVETLNTILLNSLIFRCRGISRKGC